MKNSLNMGILSGVVVALWPLFDLFLLFSNLMAVEMYLSLPVDISLMDMIVGEKFPAHETGWEKS